MCGLWVTSGTSANGRGNAVEHNGVAYCRFANDRECCRAERRGLLSVWATYPLLKRPHIPAHPTIVRAGAHCQLGAEHLNLPLAVDDALLQHTEAGPKLLHLGVSPYERGAAVSSEAGPKLLTHPGASPQVCGRPAPNCPVSMHSRFDCCTTYPPSTSTPLQPLLHDKPPFNYHDVTLLHAPPPRQLMPLHLSSLMHHAPRLTCSVR